MQPANVPKPIEQALSLPSRRLNAVTWLKVHICKSVSAIWILNQIIIISIIFFLLCTEVKEVYLV